MIRKSCFSHAANLSLGTYIVAPSFSRATVHLYEEPSLKSILLSKTPSLFLCIDRGTPLAKQKALCSELNSFYKQVEVFYINGGDGSKTWEALQSIIEFAFSKGVNQSWHIAAFGGGAVTDLVGFFSAVYMRGCPLILFPSTLLSMTDAALGGKNGINFNGIKNIIGSSSFPNFVYSSIDLLDEAQIDILHSTAEMWKHSLLHSKKAHTKFISFFQQLSQKPQAISKDDWIEEIFFNVQVKMSIVTQALDTPQRRHLLNAGHTVAHALEFASNGMMSHGTAVFYGILAEAFLGKRLGVVETSFFEEIIAFYKEYIHPLIQWSGTIDSKAFKIAMTKDKKNDSLQPKVVFLKTFGMGFEHASESIGYDLSLHDVELLIEYLQEVIGVHSL